jgi:hypothetical protein
VKKSSKTEKKELLKARNKRKFNLICKKRREEIQ